MSTNWLNDFLSALFQLLWSFFDDGGRHIARGAATKHFRATAQVWIASPAARNDDSHYRVNSRQAEGLSGNGRPKISGEGRRMTQAAEVAAENQRMRGRKPKAPQYYKFNAALNVRPPFFELANEARLQACGSLLAEPGWPDGYARLPRHPGDFRTIASRHCLCLTRSSAGRRGTSKTSADCGLSHPR